MTILIRSFTPNALSEKAGSELRERILSSYSNDSKDRIILDFEGIGLYATMFFNASIGFLIQENLTDIINNIDIINITPLGKKTLEHSKDNANFIKRNANKAEIENIVSNTISES